MDNVALEADAPVLEIPIAAANAFDAVLGQEAGLRKMRQHLQADLGELHTVSFGKRGTVSVANVPYWACLVTARRWDAEHAETLAKAYRQAGLEELVGASWYKKAIKAAKAAIKAAAAAFAGGAGAPWTPASLVTGTVLELMKDGGILRPVAEEMTRISMLVDMQRNEIKRVPGWVERIEGAQALTVVRTENGHELRSIDAAHLAKVGIQKAGDRFVIHELNWSPDTTAKVFIPALALADEEDAAKQVESELRAAELPMPTPGTSSSSDPAFPSTELTINVQMDPTDAAFWMDPPLPSPSPFPPGPVTVAVAAARPSAAPEPEAESSDDSADEWFQRND